MAVGRVGVVAGDEARARGLLMRALAAFHLANAPGVHLRRRALPRQRVARAMTERRLPLAAAPCILNAAELASLIGFPIGDVSLPGLSLGGTRQLAPASDIPYGGRVVAQATFPGGERPLALSVTDSLRHLHVIGPTGAGKSTLLLGLIAQDMAAGRGVVVLDPKGDLVSDALDRVPAARREDVVVLDPTDDERPVGLNLLAGAAESPELVVEQVAGIFHQLYKAFWGPRTDDILRAALMTLIVEPGMTLCEVPLLLTDQGFRRRLVGRVDDPVALGPFWGWYEGLSDAERTQAIGPVMNKLRAFLLRRRLRNVLGQAAPRLDLDRALAEQKILLVPLAKGLLGEEAAALLGSLVVARLWQAVQRRVGVGPNERPTTFAFIDEFQDYLNLPTSLADVLAQARGLGLGLTLAHQHLGQLPPAMREAVLANARSRVIFQVAASDARVLAHELAPHLTAADLQGLGPYEVVASLSVGARVAPPVTAASYPPPPTTGQAAAARRMSRERYGIERSTVEAAIRARHEGRRGSGTVGRPGVTS
jgi:DNA helicase HerA-like ATPase